MGKLRFTVNCNNLVHVGSFEDWVTMAKEADMLGYDRIPLIDRVVGCVAEAHPEVKKTPYTAKRAFQEVFVACRVPDRDWCRPTSPDRICGAPRR